MSIENGNPMEQYANWKAPSTENREKIKNPVDKAKEAVDGWWKIQPYFAEQMQKVEAVLRGSSNDSDEYKQAKEQRFHLVAQIQSEIGQLDKEIVSLEGSPFIKGGQNYFDDLGRAPSIVQQAGEALFVAKRNAENLFLQPDWMLASVETHISLNQLSLEQKRGIDQRFGIDKIWRSNREKSLSGFDEEFSGDNFDLMRGGTPARNQDYHWKLIDRQTNGGVVRSREGHLYVSKNMIADQ